VSGCLSARARTALLATGSVDAQARWCGICPICTKERKKENRQPKGGMGGRHAAICTEKKIKKTHNPREGWENGTPPPHRDFKERSVMR